uniref:DNA-directed RNA polymerase n=1 Tax=Physcomitrium patens TaxID=3218 RepID=A0A2K1KNH5_PHYPA|nr:hypothetical protein PHYPA_006223 [Physcomitrium patens]
MDTRHKILTLTPMLLSRAPKKVYSSPAQESHKYFSQKVEEIDTSEVFTYTPEKVLSKEKIKYVVSRTVNRNMLVAIDLLKQLKNTNNISNISSADFEALITKPLDKFLDGRVIKKQQERTNPFDTPRDVTGSFIKLLNILKRQGADVTAIKVKDNQSSLSSASKLLRMYISNNLEKNGRRIVLDPTLKNLFSEDQIQDLYDKNKGKFITQALSSFHSAGTTAVEVLEGIPRLESILNCSFKQSTSTIRTTKHTSLSDFVYLTIPDVMSSYYIEHDLDSWWYTIAEKHNFYIAPTSYNEDVVFRMIVDIKSIIFPIQICGIKSIEHVLINNNEVKTKDSNLMSTLGLDFVDTKFTISDSAVDVLKCLGIEAARNVLVRELSKVLKGDVRFDDKHINLLADFMTNKGKIVPVNISGMVERGHSYLTRASNERTMVELARAACKGVAELVQSISDSIIIGSRSKVGTSIVDILYHT